MKTKKCLAAAIFLGIFLGGCAANPEKDELEAFTETLNSTRAPHKAPVVTPKKLTPTQPNPALSPAPVVSTQVPTAPNQAIKRRQEEFERETKTRADAFEKGVKGQLGVLNDKAEDALRRLEKIEQQPKLQPVQQVARPSSNWSFSYIMLWVFAAILGLDRLRQWWRCRQSIDIPEMDIDKPEVELAMPDPQSKPEMDAAIPPSPPDEPPVEEIPLPETNNIDDVVVETVAPPVRPIILPPPPPPQRGAPPAMKPMFPPRRPLAEPNEEKGGME